MGINKKAENKRQEHATIAGTARRPQEEQRDDKDMESTIIRLF
jgi:hypothetical protein